MTTPNVEGQLGLLENAGLIELLETDPELEYLFRHALIQDAAYDSLLRADRKRLHALVGETIERRYAARQVELAPVLALHFEQAGDTERAFTYLTSAAEHALERFANHEATAFLARAGALLPEGDVEPEIRRRRAMVNLRRAEAGENRKPTDENLALLERALADAEILGDVPIQARAYLAISLERMLRGEHPDAHGPLRVAMERAAELGEASGDPALAAMPKSFFGEAMFHTARYEEAVQLLEESVPLIAAAGRIDRAAHRGGTLAIAHAQLGDFERAQQRLDEAIELGHRSGDPLAIADNEIARAMIAGLRGDAAGAIRFASGAGEMARLIDEKACAFIARRVEGEHRLLLGDSEAAASVLRAAADAGTRFGMAPTMLAFCHVLADSASARASGRVVPLEGHDGALELTRQIGDRMTEAEVLRQRARDRGARGEQLELATADYAASEASFEALGARPMLAHTLTEHGRLLAEAGRDDEARALLGRASSMFQEMGLTEAAAATAR
jgi:tetratricopeptide (TPR) repeat protein